MEVTGPKALPAAPPAPLGSLAEALRTDAGRPATAIALVAAAGGQVMK